MESKSERLRHVREQAGYKKPTDACERFGWNRSTYYGHENGSRGFTYQTATKYGRAFKVSAEWLMTGIGERVSPDVYALAEEISALAPDHRKLVHEMVRTLVSRHAPEPSSGR